MSATGTVIDVKERCARAPGSRRLSTCPTCNSSWWTGPETPTPPADWVAAL